MRSVERTQHRRTLGPGVLVVILLTAAQPATAEHGDDAKVADGTIVLVNPRVGGGAATVGSRTYSLRATVAQHEASVVSLQGGGYSLATGFHAQAVEAPPVRPDALFASGFE